MTNRKGHLVESKWREADAVACEERAIAIDDWLEHTEDLLAMLKNEEKIVTELRSMSGNLRSRRSDFTAEAEGLRTELSSKDE